MIFLTAREAADRVEQARNAWSRRFTAPCCGERLSPCGRFSAPDPNYEYYCGVMESFDAEIEVLRSGIWLKPDWWTDDELSEDIAF